MLTVTPRLAEMLPNRKGDGDVTSDPVSMSVREPAERAFEAMSLAFCLVFWWAIRRGLLVVPPAQRTAAIVRFGIGNVAYVIAIAMAFISPVSALAISALVALYYVFERTPNQPAETESEAPPLS